MATRASNGGIDRMGRLRTELRPFLEKLGFFPFSRNHPLGYMIKRCKSDPDRVTLSIGEQHYSLKEWDLRNVVCSAKTESELLNGMYKKSL